MPGTFAATPSRVRRASGVRVGARLTDRVRRDAAAAIELYERFAADRPPGWPAAGPAALLVIAEHRRACRDDLPPRDGAAGLAAGDWRIDR
jgi:hypothetical protein